MKTIEELRTKLFKIGDRLGGGIRPNPQNYPALLPVMDGNDNHPLILFL
jgi:hypothetical protein